MGIEETYGITGGILVLVLLQLLLEQVVCCELSDCGGHDEGNWSCCGRSEIGWLHQSVVQR